MSATIITKNIGGENLNFEVVQLTFFIFLFFYLFLHFTFSNFRGLFMQTISDPLEAFSVREGAHRIPLHSDIILPIPGKPGWYSRYLTLHGWVIWTFQSTRSGQPRSWSGWKSYVSVSQPLLYYIDTTEIFSRFLKTRKILSSILLFFPLSEFSPEIHRFCYPLYRVSRESS